MINASVIIPTFGTPSLLGNAVRSALNQSLEDIEVIIIDDNNPGTDERKLTEDLVNEYKVADSRIRYIKHDRNKNGSAARNTGLAIARGKYVSLLDNDDEYYPDRLEKCFNKMEQCSNDIAGVYTGCKFRRGGKTYHIERKVKAGNYLRSTLACVFMFCTGSNIFIRKSVFDELNGFDEAFLRHQDYEFLVRVFKKYSLEAIPEVLVIKNNDNFNLPNIEKIIDIKAQYLSKFAPIIKALEKKDQEYIYHKQSISIAEAALRTKRLQISREYYKRAEAYGSLTLKELIRKITFTVLIFIH